MYDSELQQIRTAELIRRAENEPLAREAVRRRAAAPPAARREGAAGEAHSPGPGRLRSARATTGARGPVGRPYRGGGRPTAFGGGRPTAFGAPRPTAEAVEHPGQARRLEEGEPAAVAHRLGLFPADLLAAPL
ncbi:hypothetical protein [Streptomyces sp. H51]|uniref:hypothetical protein n=1 Tax=Streptomyces sp. H51 TaxID=3111770 RepID=UPI002D78A3AE|nr:hypothetical protein [Streptomyces sp. H51]